MFEIVDSTSDERYFTLAIYADLETAKIELNKRLDKDCYITDSGEYENYEEIHIREHMIGWGSKYKTHCKIKRSNIYKEDTDKYVWESSVENSLT
jgi:hypothetical protein